jgi:hypothetical protein
MTLMGTARIAETRPLEVDVATHGTQVALTRTTGELDDHCRSPLRGGPGERLSGERSKQLSGCTKDREVAVAGVDMNLRARYRLGE